MRLSRRGDRTTHATRDVLNGRRSIAARRAPDHPPGPDSLRSAAPRRPPVAARRARHPRALRRAARIAPPPAAYDSSKPLGARRAPYDPRAESHHEPVDHRRRRRAAARGRRHRRAAAAAPGTAAARLGRRRGWPRPPQPRRPARAGRDAAARHHAHRCAAAARRGAPPGAARPRALCAVLTADQRRRFDATAATGRRATAGRAPLGRRRRTYDGRGGASGVAPPRPWRVLLRARQLRRRRAATPPTASSPVAVSTTEPGSGTDAASIDALRDTWPSTVTTPRFSERDTRPNDCAPNS